MGNKVISIVLLFILSGCTFLQSRKDSCIRECIKERIAKKIGNKQ
jgi:hypothetical protein